MKKTHRCVKDSHFPTEDKTEVSLSEVREEEEEQFKVSAQLQAANQTRNHCTVMESGGIRKTLLP